MTGKGKVVSTKRKGFFFVLGDDGETYFSVFGYIQRESSGYRPRVHPGSVVSFKVVESNSGKPHRIAVKVRVLEE